MKFIQDITQFKHDLLQTLEITAANENYILTFVKRWNDASTNYNNYQKLRNQFEQQIITINKTIEDLQFAINILKKTTFDNGNNYSLSDLKPVKQTIHLMEGTIINETIYLDYAIYEKDALKSTDSQMTTGIFELFKFCELMKINIIEEAGAGRGNKGKVFKLFKAITDKSKRNFIYYRKEYISSRTMLGSTKRIKPFIINGVKVAEGIAKFKQHQNIQLQDIK